MKEDNSRRQQINEQSLTQDLEKTRESLKRKLQTRRSLQQLVDVGILPSPKSSLSFYEQHKQLQMRKTQDILKQKILSRPNRQLLIEHNILSDTIAAPAIQKTQCQLKRARLVDDLNDKLSVRPGILELVANNIFQIDSNLQHYSKPKRSLTKSKSCLTFHEYKGPLQKVEITKVRLQQPMEENYYRNQLRQQQLFLELVQNEEKEIFQQSQSFETMKLVDLKNECRRLNISSTGTKIKLIEKLNNTRRKIPSQMIHHQLSLNDQGQQQQKLGELDKLKQNTMVPLTFESMSHATNNDVISNLLDENIVADSNTSSLTYIDWMAIPSPILIDNNPDFTQFLHRFDTDLFDCTYSQPDIFSFNLFSPSSSII